MKIELYFQFPFKKHQKKRLYLYITLLTVKNWFFRKPLFKYHQGFCFHFWSFLESISFWFASMCVLFSLLFRLHLHWKHFLFVVAFIFSLLFFLMFCFCCFSSPKQSNFIFSNYVILSNGMSLQCKFKQQPYTALYTVGTWCVLANENARNSSEAG